MKLRKDIHKPTGIPPSYTTYENSFNNRIPFLHVLVDCSSHAFNTSLLKKKSKIQILVTNAKVPMDIRVKVLKDTKVKILTDTKVQVPTDAKVNVLTIEK